MLNGIDIVVSEYLDDTRRAQVRFPRSKRKRIRKKWRKDPRNWKTWRVPVLLRYTPPSLFGGTTAPRIVTNDLGYAQLVAALTAAQGGQR